MDQLLSAVEGLAYAASRLVPYAPLQEHRFAQLALLGLFLLAPLCATIGIQVVNFRLAFFSEAIGHSVFTGVALGSILAVLAGATGEASHGLVVHLVMTLFGVLVAVGITAFRRSTGLSSDTIIGIFSAGAVASGLAVIGYLINTGLVPPRGIYQNLLIGNILTIQPSQLLGLLLFFLVALAVEVWAYNRFLLIGLSPEIAQTRGVNVALYEYVFAAVLSVVVMFSIQWVGVLLVTAMLVIPAAAARNFTQSAISVFWLAVLISVSAGVLGLVLSDLLRLTTGATVILCMIGVFVVSTVWSAVRERR